MEQQIAETSGGRSRSLIIIGAGMAGIKLAHTCLQKDPEMKITILEANDYIGGRIRNFEFDGYTVEMGANWISGLTANTYNNPIWKLAKDVNLCGHYSDRVDSEAVHVTDSQGNDITKAYLESVDRFDRIYKMAIQACAQRDLTPQTDVTVASLLEEFGWKENELNAIDRLVEFNLLEVWISDDLMRLGASHNMVEGANDVDLGKEEFFVEDPRGFNCIMRGMVDDIKNKGAVIKLGAQVLKVRYAPGDVNVTAKDMESGDTIMECTADAVVSTVSIGVLQNGTIEFSPPFPEWKTKALNEIDMFVFSKVYAKFQDKFWPDKDQLVICNERKGRYPLWMKYRNTDRNLFMCYLGGAEARRVESLTSEQIKDEIEELFRNAYCQGQDHGIFRPSVVAVTDWSVNPRFCGSYSTFPHRAYADVPHEDLTRGLTGTQAQEGPFTLYFAGEGFDDKFNGWIQGAYRSGLRVANSILGISE